VIGVIVNPRAGYVLRNGVEQVRSMIAEVVPDADFLVLQGHDEVASRVREFIDKGATCVAAVGGDGTVSSVAAALVDGGVSLGVIPGGTLNHFARDVGVGRHVPKAIRTLADGHPVSVDVATVNDRIFLNNSSLGVYARMVELRDREEQRFGKVRAMIRACLFAVRRTTWTEVDVSSGDRTAKVRTRLLFVGNNQYELRLLNLGRRESLEEGVLSCFVLEAPTRFHLVRVLLGSLAGGETNPEFLRSLRTTELTVDPSHESQVDVSADGEVFRMKTPLVYKIRPRALRVMVPRSW
jgi:diacylglycerol kinase family enzyme